MSTVAAVVLVLSVSVGAGAVDRRKNEIGEQQPPVAPAAEPGRRGRSARKGHVSRIEPSRYRASRVEVESAAVTFGSVVSEEGQELPAAVLIRVFSPRPWSLRLVPTQSLSEGEQGRSVDWSRLQWRNRSSAFQPFGPLGTTVARGLATPEAGELVIIDLRLEFAADDPLGRYSCSFRVVLE